MITYFTWLWRDLHEPSPSMISSLPVDHDSIVIRQLDTARMERGATRTADLRWPLSDLGSLSFTLDTLLWVESGS